MGLSNQLFCEDGSFSSCCLNPHRCFSQRFEALFPCAGALGCAVCFAPFLLVYLCANVGPREGTATCRSACPVLCHSESGPLSLSVRECGAAGLTACPVRPTLRQSQSCYGNASPLFRAARLRPSYQSGRMFLFYLLGCRTSLQFNFLSVLVVRGGAVCLPMLPSWFQIYQF